MNLKSAVRRLMAAPVFAARRQAGFWMILAGLLLPAKAGTVSDSDFQGATHLVPFEEDTINYGNQPDHGPAARLQERIDKGEIHFKFEPGTGYLGSLLEGLGVSKTTQMLVFSKTSFQRERISPTNPRALFYNDDVYVGFIPGSPLLEVTSVDPKLGGVFYTLSQTVTDRPKLVRTDQCLECHASAKSMGVPGHLLRSYAVDEQGVVDLNDGSPLINHRTPITERWGGWYVTGQHGAQLHRGNLFGAEAFERQRKEPNFLGNQTSLDKFFDTTRYPGKGSDIGALLVLEHQTHMHNFITRYHYEAAMKLQAYGHVNYLKEITTSFLKYLLFAEEAAMTNSVRPNPEFVREFESRGPKDSRGRSLRQLDLNGRLFKYPCSYLVYSDAFNALPDKARELIYQRLWDVLTGKDSNPAFARLKTEDRQAIREILRDTKPDLPAYWRETPAQANATTPPVGAVIAGAGAGVGGGRGI